MKSFLGLGVLLAPMKGQEFRDTLANRASDIADTARDSYGRAISSIRGASEQSTGTQG